MFTSFEYLNKALSIDENGGTMEDKTKDSPYSASKDSQEAGKDEVMFNDDFSFEKTGSFIEKAQASDKMVRSPPAGELSLENLLSKAELLNGSRIKDKTLMKKDSSTERGDKTPKKVAVVSGGLSHQEKMDILEKRCRPRALLSEKNVVKEPASDNKETTTIVINVPVKKSDKPQEKIVKKPVGDKFVDTSYKLPENKERLEITQEMRDLAKSKGDLKATIPLEDWKADDLLQLKAESEKKEPPSFIKWVVDAKKGSGPSPTKNIASPKMMSKQEIKKQGRERERKESETGEGTSKPPAKITPSPTRQSTGSKTPVKTPEKEKKDGFWPLPSHQRKR